MGRSPREITWLATQGIIKMGRCISWASAAARAATLRLYKDETWASSTRVSRPFFPLYYRRKRGDLDPGVDFAGSSSPPVAGVHTLPY
jgi:hypothetical protein